MAEALRGPRNPAWRDDRMLSSHGYIKVRVGSSHPAADPHGYAYEHLVVWLAAGRRAPGPGELIHHRSGCKTDNRLDNLELLPVAEHARMHAIRQARDTRGRFA